MLLQQQVAALIKPISQIETHSQVFLFLYSSALWRMRVRTQLTCARWRAGQATQCRSAYKVSGRLNSTPNPSMGEMLHKTHSARLDLAKLREQVIDPPFHPARARLTCPDSPDGATAIAHCHGDETGCCRVQQNSFRFSLIWLWELVS